jgi:hypothetical protein
MLDFYPQIVTQAVYGLITGRPRSSRWPRVRAEFLLCHGECVACGTKKYLEAHHKVPFYVDQALELDLQNLITLCRTCHFMIGHLKDWSRYNVNVDDDAVSFRRKILNFEARSVRG